MSLLDRLTSQIQDEALAAYQKESLLSLFRSEPIGDISIEKWVKKYLDDLPPAALHAAGYNPNKATLSLQEFSHKVYTADEAIVFSEKDWAFAEKWGISQLGVEMLGKKVAQTASHYLFTGLNPNNVAVEAEAQYNFLSDPGTSNGTLARPLIITSATVGAWSTYANKKTDMTKIIGDLAARGYNLATTLILYPKVASTAMLKDGDEARQPSPIEYFRNVGVLGAVALDNQYMRTAAAATPTEAAFDFYAIDLQETVIGYTREERFGVVAGAGVDRNKYAEGEVWFCPYMKPRYIVDETKFYKGVSRITAINGA